MCMACYWRAALGKLQAVRRRVARIGSFEDATHPLHSAAFTIIVAYTIPKNYRTSLLHHTPENDLQSPAKYPQLADLDIRPQLVVSHTKVG
jgi:hypothetical protein